MNDRRENQQQIRHGQALSQDGLQAQSLAQSLAPQPQSNAPVQTSPRVRQPLSVMVRNSFIVGGALGQPVREIKSYDLNTAANKNVRLEIDFAARVVWVHFDNGNGFVLSGWTPFENVMGVNYGVEPTAKA